MADAVKPGIPFPAFADSFPNALNIICADESYSGPTQAFNGQTIYFKCTMGDVPTIVHGETEVEATLVATNTTEGSEADIYTFTMPAYDVTITFE